MKHNRINKERQRLAAALERSAIPERPFVGRGPRYLVRPSVTAACAPSLRAIAAALREDKLVLDQDGLREVLTFITRGESAFFGSDVIAAQTEAERLRNLVLGPQPASVDEEHFAIAV